jgi:hypothetical protein
MNQDMFEEKVLETLNAQAKAMEETLNGFQKSLIAWETKVNVLWNSMNAVVRALDKQKLIPEALLEQAGQELYAEFKANVEKTKAAVADNSRPIGIIEMPVEKLIRCVNKGVK